MVWFGLVLWFYWWRKPADAEKTTNLSQVTDNFITPHPDRDSNSHQW